jgi:hypothetical protein
VISIFHDSHSLFYREPFGARPIKGKLRLSVETRGEEPAEVLLRLWQDGGERIFPMARKKTPADKSVWQVEITLPATPCLVWYHFVIRLLDRTVYYGNNPEQLGGRGKVYDSSPVSYQVTVYNAQKMPSWLYGGMIYQIFPDRFFNPFAEPLAKKPDSLLHDDWYRRPLYARDRATGEIMAYDFFGGRFFARHGEHMFAVALPKAQKHLRRLFPARLYGEAQLSLDRARAERLAVKEIVRIMKDRNHDASSYLSIRVRLFISQMFSAYSCTVRSEEKNPDLAIFIADISSHFRRS